MRVPGILVCCLALAAGVPRACGGGPSRDLDEVAAWNQACGDAVSAPVVSPTVQVRTFALMHGAIFDAVNGIDRRFAPLHVAKSAPAGADAGVAAAQAACTLLSGLLPDHRETFRRRIEARIEGWTGDAGVLERSRAWGDSVARAWLDWRADDGFSRSEPFDGRSDAGYWRHPPLETSPAGGTNMIATRPLVLTDPDAFDPGPPYGIHARADMLRSPDYAADLAEARRIGAKSGGTRTPEQTDEALFIHRLTLADLNRDLVALLPASASLVERARVLALANIAGHDASCVLFRAKYRYALWRPFQAIRFADTDGNDATTADPGWEPLEPTPPHPEYPSGHCQVITAITAAAAAVLGDTRPITPTARSHGTTRGYANLAALSAATIEGRVAIGFHLRRTCEVSTETGQRIAHAIVAQAMTPIPGP